MGYAVTGMIVAWLLLTSPAVQRGVIITCGALHLAFISLIAFFATGSASGTPLPTPYADGGFLDLARFRIEYVALFRTEMFLIGLLSIAMFLAGAHLLRAGVFTREGAWLRRRLMLIGGIALPIDLALGVFGGTGGVMLQRYALAPLVACGLLGLIAELCLRRGTAGPIAEALRDAGRVALSCYLMQNLLSGAIFYGWGLGLAVQLELWRLWVTMGAYALIAGVMILFARAWMRRFRVGPVEWLWQRGTALVPERPARTGSG